nr:hypothetical protein GCM10017745_39870 [Saccharothrix mutabilis subsp. capreolus]
MPRDKVNSEPPPLDHNTTAHLCGPVPFMRHIRAGLLRRGFPDHRIRYEVFGPGMLDDRIG